MTTKEFYENFGRLKHFEIYVSKVWLKNMLVVGYKDNVMRTINREDFKMS